MNSNLYSTKDLENLNELRLELVEAIKSKDQIKDQINPLREEKDSFNLQIEECENRYNELCEKGKSISLEEAEEMADLINNIRNCRVEKTKLEEKILEFGKQLKEVNNKKSEIEDKIEELNNKVKENIVPNKTPIKGIISINSIKSFIGNKIKVTSENCAIISTMKKSEMSLKRIFGKNENTKVEELSEELVEKINNSDLISKIRDLSEHINKAKEEYEERLDAELKIKDIEKECDEYEKEQELSDEPLNIEDHLEFIEKDDQVEKSEDSKFKLLTEEEMEQKAQERISEVNKEKDVINTNLKLKEEEKNVEKKQEQEGLRLSTNEEMERKVRLRSKEEEKVLPSVNEDLKQEKIVPENEIGNIQVNLFETPAPVQEESNSNYIKPAVSFPPRNNFTTDAEIIDNIKTVIKETYRPTKEDRELVENVKNNFPNIEQKALERVDSRKCQTGSATRTKLRERINPTFIDDNGNIAHIIEVVNGKVMSVKSEQDLIEVRKFANETIKQNVSSKQELLQAQHAVNNLFEEAKENQIGKAM